MTKMRMAALGLLLLLGGAGALKGVVGMSYGGSPAAGKSEAETLRALDRRWSDAAARKDLDAVVSFMADDGETLAPNLAPVAYRGSSMLML